MQAGLGKVGRGGEGGRGVGVRGDENAEPIEPATLASPAPRLQLMPWDLNCNAYIMERERPRLQLAGWDTAWCIW